MTDVWVCDMIIFVLHSFISLQREWSWMDFAPLMGVYSIVFLYISFSVGKNGNQYTFYGRVFSFLPRPVFSKGQLLSQL